MHWRRGLLAAGLAVLSACAGVGSTPAPDAPAVELTDTPFFPQKKYQCGPSALATVLAHAGVDVDVDVVAEQVFVPARRGSLQPELVAAARRHGLLPVQASMDFASLVALLGEGLPVVVLQNLGFGPVRLWHYATVVGYLRATDQVVLRSGRTRRHLMARRAFLRTWQRGDYWALVVVKPGRVPAAVAAGEYVDAVVRLEASGDLDGALSAYRAGLARWPGQPTLALGVANTLYGLGDKLMAARAYRDALAREPDNVVLVNNLAQTLLELGCAAEALDVIDRVAGRATGEAPWAAAVGETRSAIVAALARSDHAAACEAG